jgi:hypothetical protein
MAKRKKSRTNTGIPGLSFSWRQVAGITKAKHQFSRKTGIPTTKSGRQQKIGRTASGGGCLLPVLLFLLIILVILL